MAVSKKLLEARSKVDPRRVYGLEEALELVKATAYAKFDASVDLAFTLNLDTRQADQQLRGAVALPHSTGKVVRVLVVTDDAAQQAAAKQAGADSVIPSAGLADLLASGKFDFDIIITDPKSMPVFGKFGKQLGPKGLMPNPKTGTVAPQVAKALAEIKRGKANYRTDKAGIVHTSIGKVSMPTAQLAENAATIIDTIRRLKPATVKGNYMKNLTASATMGPAVKIEFKV